MSSSSFVPPPPIPANPAPPGVILPQVKPLTVGTSTPGQSAMVTGQLNNNKQTSLFVLQGGRKKFRGGATSTQFSVPQFQTIYPCTGGPSQCPNSIIQSTTGTGAQTYSNQVYDGLVGQTAGSRICSSGQTKCWGCYSGGKRSTRKYKYKLKKRRNTKSKKSRNSKSKKSRNSKK